MTTERPALSDWLDCMEEERRSLLMRLGQLERTLVKHGRLRHRKLARRQREGDGN